MSLLRGPRFLLRPKEALQQRRDYWKLGPGARGVRTSSSSPLRSFRLEMLPWTQCMAAWPGKKGRCSALGGRRGLHAHPRATKDDQGENASISLDAFQLAVTPDIIECDSVLTDPDPELW